MASNVPVPELVPSSSKNSKKRGGQFCVSGGPNGVRCTNSTYSDGVSMHTFPSNMSTNRLWAKFVRFHRADFRPSKSSSLCSEHFDESCYTNRFGNFRRQLERGSVPTIFTKSSGTKEAGEKSIDEREKRLVSRHSNRKVLGLAYLYY